MTRMNMLNFPTTFAVFRKHHFSLTFQIIKAIETYEDTNVPTYSLKNENNENPDIYQRYQSVGITLLPYQNSQSVNIIRQGTRRVYRMRWNSNGLFLKVRNFGNETLIPILTISDYSLLPNSTPYSICFVEHNFTRAVQDIIEDTELSEERQWLSIQHLIENWFTYSGPPLYPRHSLDLPYHLTGPDDHDDRLTISRGELIGAGIQNNRRRPRYSTPQEYLTALNDMEEQERARTPRNRDRQSNENRYSGAGAAVETTTSSSSSSSTTNQTPIRLQKFTIDAIIEYAVNTEMSCPISMVQLTRHNCGVLSCQHVFEKESIQRWMNSNTQCPLCRETSVIC